MPTYQYRCKDCGHELEVVQSFSDDALTTCPECDGALKKVYGAVGISFKGSGFYKNDARGSSGSSSSSGGSATSTSSSSSDGGSSASSSSDSSSGSSSSDSGSSTASTAATSSS